MKFNDINMKEFICIELEQEEDRSVGMFGNFFAIIFKDDNDIQQQIIVDDEQLYQIRKKINNIIGSDKQW